MCKSTRVLSYFRNNAIFREKVHPGVTVDFLLYPRSSDLRKMSTRRAQAGVIQLIMCSFFSLLLDDFCAQLLIPSPRRRYKHMCTRL